MKRLLVLILPLAIGLYGKSVDNIEAMTQRIKSKRVSEIPKDRFFNIPAPMKVMIKVDKNATKDKKKKSIVKTNMGGESEVGWILGAIINNKAYLNGTWVKVGDTISGFKVVKIYDDSVELKLGKRDVRVFLTPKSDLIKIANGEKK
ncbi:MAG: hypothetical protein GXO02_03765 [Epsilonproteobacteria bacterium]|nr:hypothetical protein [Campylobacterota bacterium]